MIPSVVASERGRAQTGDVATRRRCSRTELWHCDGEPNGLESPSAEGESPVGEAETSLSVS